MGERGGYRYENTKRERELKREEGEEEKTREGGGEGFCPKER